MISAQKYRWAIRLEGIRHGIERLMPEQSEIQYYLQRKPAQGTPFFKAPIEEIIWKYARRQI